MLVMLLVSCRKPITPPPPGGVVTVSPSPVMDTSTPTSTATQTPPPTITLTPTIISTPSIPTPTIVGELLTPQATVLGGRPVFFTECLAFAGCKVRAEPSTRNYDSQGNPLYYVVDRGVQLEIEDIYWCEACTPPYENWYLLTSGGWVAIVEGVWSQSFIAKD